MYMYMYVHIKLTVSCVFVDLLTVPPGFSRGMNFEPVAKDVHVLATEKAPPPETVSVSELLGGGDMVMEWRVGGGEEREKEEGEKNEENANKEVEQVWF